ncbi:hypothetical protein DOTSEDRAFT_54929 [Dothistroma septosporum NZE10]|uniref:Uncharacterized protein n=1 Tax=Dothistroma septosporum (strain NZE10 / CBS 128990) TaxID=675120 RepID=N1PJ55_DOTSN|nr:hypothetical protein DOTSEDRAFT_54929 [Dothistroma septosporum NZE10]
MENNVPLDPAVFQSRSRSPRTSDRDAGPSTQPNVRPRQSRSRADSISPPRGYIPPQRDHTPPPPTTQIPDAPAWLQERQAIVDGYVAALAQRRNDSNFPMRLLVDNAAIMTKQLLAQRDWLNRNARLRLSLPSWMVQETAEAQDHLLRRMSYTGWVNRGAEIRPQEWRNGVCLSGPGNVARQQALRRRQDVSPFEQF